MPRLGTVSLQAMDDTDVFFTEDVSEEGIRDINETSCLIPEPGFDEDKAWVSGDVPDAVPVCVEGDTSVIYGWFKGENFSFPFKVRIYIEYWEVEQVIEEEKQ